MRTCGRLLLAGLLAGVFINSGTAQVTLHGTVTDSAGRPLGNVQVSLDGVSRTGTNALGRFAVRGVQAGAHFLQFERIGVEPRFLRFTIPSDIRDSLDTGAIQLDLLATTLDDIVVRAPRYEMDIPGQRELQQLQRSGFGHLLTAEQIDDMNPSDLRDILRRIPGVNVGGSLVSFVGGGQISCPRGATFIVDGVRTYTLGFFNDPERQVKSMWSYRGVFDRCGVIVIETNAEAMGNGSPGEVGVRLANTWRNGSNQIERIGIFMSLPLSDLIAFYPAAETRRGNRQGWSLQLAFKVAPVGTLPAYIAAGVMLGKDDAATVFGSSQIRGVPLVLAGVSLPVMRFRLIGEIQLEDPLTGTGRLASVGFGLGYRFGPR